MIIPKHLVTLPLKQHLMPVSPSPGLVKLFALSNKQARGSFAPDGLISPGSMLHFALIT